MARESVSIRRRTFLAIVSAGSAVVAGSVTSQLATDRHHTTPVSPMDIDRVYQITRQYYVGPKRDRPPANEAKGTIWEVTDGKQTDTTRRTLSDGDRWITLNIESESKRPGEYYLTPEDGVEGIQDVIDRTGGNVVVRLAPGTYVGSELTLAHGVTLHGSGCNATTIKLKDDANADLITTPDPPRNNVMQCTLRNITFDGNKGNNSAGNVVYGAFWNSRFINCGFHSAPETGFWLAGSTASTDDNYFAGCRFITNRGTGLRGGANKESHPAVGVVRVDTNWFGNNSGPAIVARGNAWRITNAKLYRNAAAQGASIELDRCSYSTVSGCDSYMEHSDRDHVIVRAAEGATSVGNQIKNNDFRGNYRSAIRCVAESNDITALQVRGNTIQSGGNASNGIVAHAENGSFIDCAFTNNVFTGVLTDSKLDLSNGWTSEGNLNAA
ncbi:right-handed parallel beta-helix repeat-containing protein [Halocatena pleomorpha]|uniref:Right-handed parallel beta-helix repeat-containing protein n=1 Tax=Halocatena pleomorpha TaxID=1785090 RepID=A0A3P3RE93_9EURY|nr:right-handed parallel beta-helix repeat-containing protein [Halocatena pleomorpha]RRJ31822.1 right-handed parallel beta-helix repeat-containing protein [Halocatena pleomorpha]